MSLPILAATLTRSITGHTPVTRAQRTASNPLPTDSPLVMIGHPTALCTKVDAGGKVCGSDQDYYYANTDSFGGNSGSGVFHRTTGELEGILVTGDTDYVTPDGRTCLVPYVLPNTDCNEGITKIVKILDAPTTRPTRSPTKRPSRAPTKRPSIAPTKIPARAPTKKPKK